MARLPRGGLLGKTVRFFRELSRLRIPLYAANASFFIVLSVFPALHLLLGLLRYTALEVERLGEILYGVLPAALVESAEELILTAYDNSSGVSLSLSALAALWSAGKGVHGIMTGLNAVYRREEQRGYFCTRLLSGGYTFAFLLVLLLTLALHVFGGRLAALLDRGRMPFLAFLTEIIDFRFFLLLFVQTGVFTAMFMALPCGGSGFWDSLPGALLASSGWLVFSDVFSIYVEHFASLAGVYGSVYAVALSMLWLYCCMAIVFYGGACNRYWMER